MIKVLFISYDGMTDALGQSQVIPYLQGLSEKGCDVTILSAEKKENYNLNKEIIDIILKKSNIKWEPVIYHKNPPVFSTLLDIYFLKQKAKKLYLTNSYDIIHCRSYISALIGLYLKKKFKAKFIFDMRGFFPDERVDGELWDQNKIIFAKIYKYFKKKEKDFLQNADYTISLTRNGRDEINKWNIKNLSPIHVIPCCADIDFFSQNNVSLKEKLDWANLLGIKKDDFVLSYIGSLGTWYLMEEMLDFFKQLLIKKSNAKFLFITKEPKEMIFKYAKDKNIPLDKIIVKNTERKDMPSLISLSDVSIFFIKPAFSKKASSPTKMGEIMSMGIPIICNSGVGDVECIVNDTNAGYLINEFTDENYNKAIDNLDNILNIEKSKIIEGAQKYYSLNNGVEEYFKVYNKLI